MDLAFLTIAEIVQSESFMLNLRKTRIARRNAQQLVTGLVVNAVPNLPRQRRKRIRAMFHQAELHPELFQLRKMELSGYRAYLGMVRPDDPSLSRYTTIIDKIEGTKLGE